MPQTQYIGKRIYTVEEVERWGNRIMAHQSGCIFVLERLPVKDITPAHIKDEKRYAPLMSLISKGTPIPPIVVDRANQVMDGNTRYFALKELGKEYVIVFKAVGEFYPE